MKKKILSLLLAALMLVSLLPVTALAGGDDPTFYPCNGEKPGTVEMNATTPPADPEWEGYTFTGWYTAATGGTLVHDGKSFKNGDSKFEEDATFYAHWKNAAGKSVLTETLAIFDDGVYVGYQSSQKKGTKASDELLADCGIEYKKECTYADGYSQEYSRTLTLKGADICSTTGVGLYIDEAVTIHTAEDSSISAISGADNLYGISADCFSKPTFTGTGNLTVTAGNAEKVSAALNCSATFNMTGTVTFRSEGGKEESCGIKGSIICEYGSVYAIAGPTETTGVSYGFCGRVQPRAGVLCASTTAEGDNAYAAYNTDNVMSTDYDDSELFVVSGATESDTDKSSYKQSGDGAVRFSMAPLFYIEESVQGGTPATTQPTGDDLTYPARSEYTFLGWYDQRIGGVQIMDAEGKFTAKWTGPSDSGCGKYVPASGDDAMTEFIGTHQYYAHYSNGKHTVFTESLVLDSYPDEKWPESLDGYVSGIFAGVNEVNVNDEYEYSVIYDYALTADEWAEYGISYDPGEHKLTLDDASFTECFEIDDSDALTIELKGNVRIGEGYGSDGDGNPDQDTLIVNGPAIDVGNRVNGGMGGNLTVTGSGNLTIYSDQQGIVAKSITFDDNFSGAVDITVFDSNECISTMGDENYENGKILIQGGSYTGRHHDPSEEVTLISANGDITITGGQITGEYRDYYGVISAAEGYKLIIGTEANPVKIANGAYYAEISKYPEHKKLTALESPFYGEVLNGILNATKEGVSVTLSFKTPVTVSGVCMADTYTYGDGKTVSCDSSAVKAVTKDVAETDVTASIDSWTCTYYQNTGTAESPSWTTLDAAPTGVGNYKLVVEAVDSEYEGKQEIEFAVAPKTVTISVSDIAAQEFTGAQLAPDVTVTSSDATLTVGTDYTVSYGDNVDSGTNAGSVTVVPKDGSNYTFTAVTKSFDITPKSAAVTWTKETSYTYTGEVQTAPTASYQDVDGQTVGCTVESGLGKHFWSAGLYVFTAKTSDPNYTLTNNELKVEIGKVTLTPSVASVTTKGYDGTTDATGTIALTGAVGSDEPTATGTFIWKSAAVGETVVNVTNITLGDDFENDYTLSTTTLSNVTAPASVSITKGTTLPQGTPTTYTVNATSAVSASLSDMGITLDGAKIKSIAPESATTTYVITDVPTIVAPDNVSISWTTQETPSSTDSDVYTLTVESTNYNDFTVTVTFVGKTVVTFPETFAFGGGDLVYGTEYSETTPELKVDDDTVTPDVTYSYEKKTGENAWEAVSSKPTDAGTYRVTIAVDSADNTYTGSKTYEFTIAKADQDVPALADAVTINYADEKITPKTGYEVSTGSGDDFESGKLSDETSIDFINTYYIRKAADNNHNASAEMSYIPARPDAVSGVTAKQESIKNRDDGYLQGVTEDMEYCVSIDGGANYGSWVSGYGGSIGFPLSTLSSDAYYTVKVRTKATDSTFAGEETTFTFTHSEQLVTVNMGEESVQVDAETPVEKKTPTKEGYTFGGWFIDEELQNPWNFGDKMDDATLNMLADQFDNLTEDYAVTFYPKWIEDSVPSAPITGTVTENGADVSEALVELYQGNKQIAVTTTGTDGSYSFDNLESGTYNIVITKTDGKTKTELVTVNGESVSVNVELPTSDVNSVVEVQTAWIEDSKSDISKTVVGGLDTIAAAKTPASGQTITIKMTVEPKEEYEVESAEQIKTEAGSGKKVEFLDMSLWQITTTASGTLQGNIGGSNDTLLTIVISFDFTGVDVSSVTIIRKHGDDPAEKLTKDPAPDQEGFTVDRQAGTITVYAMKFSDYALAYAEQTYTPGGGTNTYSITGADTENGKLTLSRRSASAGQTVTITVAPDEGYKLNTLTVKDANGNALTLTKVNDTTYSFKMPSSKVTISATFAKIGACPQDETCVYAKFTDADTKAWYHDGVHFCVENGYMQGVSTTAFDPAGTTTRAMIVTMLWRLEGEPVVNYAMSFKDVKVDHWYTEAIRWAQSTGVVEGYSAEAFGPNDPITREQMATILYRYAKYHSIDVANTNTLAGYTDVNKVSSWALDALKWANAARLVQGRTTTTLVPEVSITRAEAATMVQRYCEAFKK